VSVDRTVTLNKLDLLRRALLVAIQHVDVLRDALTDDDVDGVTRGRLGFENAMELCSDLRTEIDAEIPDWRPAPPALHHSQPDGFLGATEE
jgi:hypothetical protein